MMMMYVDCNKLQVLKSKKMAGTGNSKKKPGTNMMHNMSLRYLTAGIVFLLIVLGSHTVRSCQAAIDDLRFSNSARVSSLV